MMLNNDILTKCVIHIMGSTLQSHEPTKYIQTESDYRGNVAFCDLTIEDNTKSQFWKTNYFFISYSMHICLLYSTNVCVLLFL
jgi:hypothetical protein